MNVLAIIPARSGSKSVQHKNIASINGKPLMAYSIEHARQCKLITRVIVSTDSEYYGEIAKAHGAEVPFIRPAEISDDHSTDLETFQHALRWLKIQEGYVPDICVHLRPTCPVRKVEDITAMINLLLVNSEADSVRSVTPAKETPYKMWFVEKSGQLSPAIRDENFPEGYNMPRQRLPVAYLQNAAIDVMRTSTVMEKNSMTGSIILGYKMAEMFDIDYAHELTNATEALSSRNNLDAESKTFCFDIDGVVAQLSPNNQYNLAQPNLEVIEKINRLYREGHTIILFTARGTKTGIDWQEVTRNQMDTWGVHYHELKFGKPAADYYIDDRSIDISKL